MRKLILTITISLLFISGCTYSSNDDKEKLDDYRNDIETLSSLKNRLNEIKKEKQILFTYHYKGNYGLFYFEKVNKNATAANTDNSLNSEEDAYKCEGVFDFDDSTSISVQIDEKGNLQTGILKEKDSGTTANEIIKSIKSLNDLPGFSELKKTEDSIDKIYNYLETVNYDEYAPVCYQNEDLNVCQLQNDRIEFSMDGYLMSTGIKDKNIDISYYCRVVNGIF